MEGIKKTLNYKQVTQKVIRFLYQKKSYKIPFLFGWIKQCIKSCIALRANVKREEHPWGYQEARAYLQNKRSTR